MRHVAGKMITLFIYYCRQLVNLNHEKIDHKLFLELLKLRVFKFFLRTLILLFLSVPNTPVCFCKIGPRCSSRVFNKKRLITMSMRVQIITTAIAVYLVILGISGDFYQGRLEEFV